MNHLQVKNDGALLEKVITNNDLGGLSPLEKVQHIKNVCASLGLNPLTKPIQLLKFQGKEIAYFTKDATEQLRKKNNISITKVENKIIDGIYVVTVFASTPEGRTDASTGAITVVGLKAEALCNAMLKAETKAKRRVTLSICGLGYIDESEADSIPKSQKVDVYDVKLVEQKQYPIEEMCLDVSQVSTLGELEEMFKVHYKVLVSERDQEGLRRLIEAKDKKKEAIQLLEEFNNEINSDTGEVKS